MAKSDDREENLKRKKILRERLGVSPTMLGTAVMAGAPVLAGPILTDAPFLLYQALRSGSHISPESMGESLDSIPEFTSGERSAIKAFAKAQGVAIPILAGKETFYNGKATLLGRLLGQADDEHISLDSTSIPGAFHEIGHATRPLRGRAPLFAEVMRNLVSIFGPGRPLGGIVRGGIAVAGMAPVDTETSPTRRFVHDHAPALVGATALPYLLEEARASGHALRGARAHGPGVASALKELGPAYATYLGAAAAPVIATVLAQRLVQYLYDRAGTEKAAADPKMSGNLRAPAQAAWRVGAFPKPKTTSPGPARSVPVAAPPSKRAFYGDVTKSLNDPSRGVRQSLVPPPNK